MGIWSKGLWFFYWLSLGFFFNCNTTLLEWVSWQVWLLCISFLSPDANLPVLTLILTVCSNDSLGIFNRDMGSSSDLSSESDQLDCRKKVTSKELKIAILKQFSRRNTFWIALLCSASWIEWDECFIVFLKTVYLRNKWIHRVVVLEQSKKTSPHFWGRKILTELET